MLTVALNAYSSAFPDITNRTKASVSREADPLAIIAFIIDTTVGHPARIWSFPGLPRDNYRFSVDEIDAGGVVLQNLALFSVVPGEVEGLLNRDDEQIIVGTTPGLIAGLSVATFDGTAGKPDYRGWEIVPSELNGRSPMAKNLDYSWDKDTGLFSLLLTLDRFNTGQYYNIHFNPISSTEGNSYPSVTDFNISVITDPISLDVSYFGKKLICIPTPDYMEVILPDIATVPQGRRLMVEVSDTAISCVRFVPFGSDQINFLRGNIYILPDESLSIYKFINAGVPEWRVCDTDGNFKTVGQSVYSDTPLGFNMTLMNGDSLLATQFARLYNEIVLNLPVSQVVNYDVWATGNNKYFYSLANSSNPSFAGRFHIPDRRTVYYRNGNGSNAGLFQGHQMQSHQHIETLGLNPVTLWGRTAATFSGRGTYAISSTTGLIDLTSLPCSNTGVLLTNVGTETRPDSVLINQFVNL